LAKEMKKKLLNIEKCSSKSKKTGKAKKKLLSMSELSKIFKKKRKNRLRLPNIEKCSCRFKKKKLLPSKPNSKKATRPTSKNIENKLKLRKLSH
jgi:hypothetical protein